MDNGGSPRWSAKRASMCINFLEQEKISPLRGWVFVQDRHPAGTYQPLVPGEDHRVQHGLVEEAVAHPLRDDDVHLLHGQLHLLHLALEDGDDCAHARKALLHFVFLMTFKMFSFL